MGEGVRRLYCILGSIKAEGQSAIDWCSDAGTGGLSDGFLAAHVRPHQVRDRVICVVFQLVLYPLVDCVGLNHRLRENDLQQRYS